MKTPLVSVLMPVYNGEPYLREAMESVLFQSFRDFEFVIVDDGSTDRTEEIVRSFDDARIRFYTNGNNRGISETLNRGIDLCRAKWIARMDADDVNRRDRLERQVRYLHHNPDCALLSTWARVMRDDKEFVRMERFRSEFYPYNLTFQCWIYHPTVIYRKDAVLAVGKYSMPYSEDYDLFWRLSTRYRIANLELPLVNYRLSATSLNSVTKKQEYAEAERRNVLRNIRYYLGSDFTLPEHWLSCLRHDFQPMAERRDPGELFACLDLLERLTRAMLKRGNGNAEDVLSAHDAKRRFIVQQVALAMGSKSRELAILLKAGAWSAIASKVMRGVSWRMKRSTKTWR